MVEESFHEKNISIRRLYFFGRLHVFPTHAYSARNKI